MKALQLNEEKELKLVDLPQPELKPNELLIKVKASALNHRELWISKGLYPGMSLPCILGADGAGTVCLLYTSPSPRDRTRSRMPSSA